MCDDFIIDDPSYNSEKFKYSLCCENAPHPSVLLCLSLIILIPVIVVDVLFVAGVLSMEQNQPWCKENLSYIAENNTCCGEYIPTGRYYCVPAISQMSPSGAGIVVMIIFSGLLFLITSVVSFGRYRYISYLFVLVFSLAGFVINLYVSIKYR